MQDGADSVVSVSLLTGFLGSGKTTLLNRLLRAPGMQRTAVLVNEFGDIGIDHALVEQVDESMVTLSAGCLCCTIQGDLSRTLRELFVRRVKGDVPPFRRVLIETTGLADPAPVLHTLLNDPVVANRFELDGVITTVDALHGAGQLVRHPESCKQAAVADRIVMTKTDLGEPRAMDALEERLHAINPGAPVIRATHGDVAPERLFGCGLYDPETKSFDVRGWLQEEAFRARQGGGHEHHNHVNDNVSLHDPNRHGDDIEAFCLVRHEPIEWPAFVAWMQTLISHRGENLLRIKGIVNITDEPNPIAIHGVQHVLHPPVRLPRWPDGDRRSRIVFITRGLERRVIENSLEMLQQAARDQSATAAFP
jgi:G3E family GTPase